MKLSTKGRYGLRALIDLALYSENETVSIASISARQNISESYLEQLIAKLRKAGLVTSVRGAAAATSWPNRRLRFLWETSYGRWREAWTR